MPVSSTLRRSGSGLGPIEKAVAKLVKTRLLVGIRAAAHGMLHPFLRGGALSHTEALRRAGHHLNVRHGDYVSQGDQFHIHARDAKAGLEAAEKLSAHRQYAERIRYGQRSQA